MDLSINPTFLGAQRLGEFLRRRKSVEDSCGSLSLACRRMWGIHYFWFRFLRLVSPEYLTHGITDMAPGTAEVEILVFAINRRMLKNNRMSVASEDVRFL